MLRTRKSPLDGSPPTSNGPRVSGRNPCLAYGCASGMATYEGIGLPSRSFSGVSTEPIDGYSSTGDGRRPVSM